MAAFCAPPGVTLGEKTGYFHEGGVGGPNSIGRMRISVGEVKDVWLQFYKFNGREVWVRSQNDRIARIVKTSLYNDNDKIYSVKAGDELDKTYFEAGQGSTVWFKLEVQVTGTAAALAKAYDQAFAMKNWDRAAELLNGFNPDDILAKIGPLTVGDLLSLEMGAKRNPRVGAKSNVAAIIHDVVSAVAPEMYAQSAFPNNFGDKLGPVGGVAIGVAAGVLALRLAAPLLINYWRQISITMGMAKIASETEEQEAAIAGEEIRTVIQRLINTGGPQRVFVTYQSASPAADRELYLATESGQQYAQALAQGRNLYMLRIPERLYQVLLQRQLIEIRQGSMYGQIGEDIRISPGAMQFLSQHFKQVPLKE